MLVRTFKLYYTTAMALAMEMTVRRSCNERVLRRDLQSGRIDPEVSVGLIFGENLQEALLCCGLVRFSPPKNNPYTSFG